MQASAEAVELFQTLLNLEKPRDGKDAAGAMIAAARQSRWCRNQACASLVSSGAVACILDGGVRKFAVRPNGQRQIIDVVVTGDFLGFTPPDPAFALEAVANNTRIASFTREQIDALAARFPAISVLIKSCAADAIRRLEHHLLVQSRITARDKVGAYLAEMARRLKRSRTDRVVLPITRYDIADHLGIAVETVSRTMTLLRRGGSIELRTPRDIEIRDEAALSDPLSGPYC